MKNAWILLQIVFLTIFLTACGSKNDWTNVSKSFYTRVAQEKSSEHKKDLVVVDVRTQEEYDSGHVDDAICIPNESITDMKPPELPNLNVIIIVYGSTAYESREATIKLYNIGYDTIYDFGALSDWESGDNTIYKTPDRNKDTDEDSDEVTTEEPKGGGAGIKWPSGNGGGKLQKKDSTTGRKKQSTSATTEFDPDDHDIEAYYEDNRDIFEDYDEAYDAFEDDEDAWDDY